MIVESLEVGPFAENCYVVGCRQTMEGVVIDPGDEAPRILSKVLELRLRIKFILLTHAHLDHVKELAAVNRELGVPVFMHREDQFLLDNMPAQAAAFGLTTSGTFQIDKYVDERDAIEFGEHRFEILHTPGHSPGSVTYFANGLAFVGDVLFSGSIGRTDLPGGNYDLLIDSIKSRLYPLGDETVIYPGHGPTTTIGREKHANPFLREQG